MSKQRLRVVQMGTGHDHADPVMRSLRTLTDTFEVVGYTASDGPTAEVYEGLPRFEPEEALNRDDLDAVIIETEDLQLTRYARMAVDRGLPVHMDKPGGLSQTEYADMLRAAKAKGLVFHTGYMYRHNPAVQKVLAMADRGELGEIYSVEAHMDCFHLAEKRQWLEQFPGGMMYFLGCHLIDLIYRIQGEPEEVIPYNISTGMDGVTAKDYGMAVLQYRNGISFAKTCAVEAGGFLRRQLVVCGSKGTVELKPLEQHYGATESLRTGIRFTSAEGATNWNADTPVAYMDNRRYSSMLEAFAAIVRGEAENPYSYDYEERLHALVLRACGAE